MEKTKIYDCHHYTYLPFIPSDLLKPCVYCKENKRQRPTDYGQLALKALSRMKKD